MSRILGMTFLKRWPLDLHEAFLKVWINLTLADLEAVSDAEPWFRELVAVWRENRISWMPARCYGVFDELITTAEQRDRMIQVLEEVRVRLMRRPPWITPAELKVLMAGDPLDEDGSMSLPMEHFVTMTESMIALLHGTFTLHGPVDPFH